MLLDEMNVAAEDSIAMEKIDRIVSMDFWAHQFIVYFVLRSRLQNFFLDQEFTNLLFIHVFDVAKILLTQPVLSKEISADLFLLLF